MVRTFRDYEEVKEEKLEGFTVARVQTGINAEETGMMFELERKVDNVVLGIDIIYNPDHDEDETEMMVSDEYVKRIL
ncbi:hypothetical protein [Roseburia hominis]|uniref:hypothetical protein n=1 Tax=Roseburia hominis TaxID=301301 RepID=UPI00265B03C8|nr:hypothetical protein [Roseburia hominis]